MAGMADLADNLRVLNNYGSQFLPVLSYPGVLVSYRQAVDLRPTAVTQPFSIPKVITEIKQAYRTHGFFNHPGFWSWFNPLEGGFEIVLSFIHTMVEDYFGLPALESLSGATVRNESSPYFNGWKAAIAQVVLCICEGLVLRPIGVARNRLVCQLPLPSTGVQLLPPRYKYTGFLSTLKSLRNESLGFASKGLVPALLSRVAFDFTFSTFETMKPSVAMMNRFSSRTNGLWNGALHAFSLGIDNAARWGAILAVTWPLELITKRLDIQGTGVAPFVTNYASWTDCAGSIWREEGLAGFYKGVVAEFLTNVGLAFIVGVTSDLLISTVFGPPASLVALAEAREVEEDDGADGQ